MKGRVPKKHKRIRKQREYHSSSEDETDEEYQAHDAPVDFQPVELESSEEDKEPKPGPKSILKASAPPAPEKPQSEQLAEATDKIEDGNPTSEDEDEDDEEVDEYPEADLSDEESDLSDEGSDVSETSTNNPRKVRKRNDPEAFATSISKILNSKLTTKNRSEPILARSKSAYETNQALADHKLTIKAHRTLLAEKKSVQDRGRVKDVLGLDTTAVSTAAIVAEEKRLKRTAQKGVIKLFNAVRAAQVKAEMAQKEVQKEGVVGMAKREEKVREMSKQGFLDMIAGGGKTKEGSVEA